MKIKGGRNTNFYSWCNNNIEKRNGQGLKNRVITIGVPVELNQASFC